MLTSKAAPPEERFVILLRHGIAEDPTEGKKDEDRSLTPEGHARMKQIARGLERTLPRAQVIYTSPLLRAMQTALWVSKGYRSRAAIVTTDALAPAASSKDFLALVNGSITVRNVTGAVVADTVNGKVTDAIDKITTDKAMSFSTLNGEVDVTLPADLKANLKIKSGHGETYSDFYIVTRGTPSKPVEEKTSSGRRRVRFDSAMYGTINGGGPEIQFSTLNGTIYIRKKK